MKKEIGEVVNENEAYFRSTFGERKKNQIKKKCRVQIMLWGKKSKNKREHTIWKKHKGLMLDG